MTKIPHSLKTFSPKTSLYLYAAFILSFLNWTYLAMISQMVVVQDSIGYVNVGTAIYKNGWIEYFKTGPNREPLYLFLISLSLRLGDWFSISYQTILILIQISVLLISQILTLILLKRLKINDLLSATVILYLGVSPALVNSAFIIYSEIAAYPLVLGIVLTAEQVWRLIREQNNTISLIGYSILMGILLALTTFLKAIFELITPLFLLPYILFALQSWLKKDFVRLRKSAILLAVCLMSFYGPVTSFKAMNNKYNGQFVVRNGGSMALYGNIDRRMEPLNTKRALTALSYVAGWQTCQSFFPKEECDAWSNVASDTLATQKRWELSRQMSREQVDQTLIRLSLKKIIANPFQFTLLTGIESLKMFFWEELEMKFVVYPDPVSKLYTLKPLKYGIKILMPLLTLAGLINSAVFIWVRRKSFFEELGVNAPLTLIFYSLFLITIYISLLSAFYIDPRYILLLVPLHLVSLAFFVQTKIKKGSIAR